MKTVACVVAAVLTLGIASPPSPPVALQPAESVVPGFLEMEVSTQMVMSQGKTKWDQLDNKQKYLAYVNTENIMFCFIQNFPGGQPKHDVVRLQLRDGKVLWVFDEYSKLGTRLRKSAKR